MQGTNTNEIYYYLRGKVRGKAPKAMKKKVQNGSPLVTVCISQLPDGKVCRGVAVCSPRDIPNKKEGRRVARNYMLKARGTKRTSIAIQRNEAQETVWNEVAALFSSHSTYNIIPNNLEIKLLYELQKREAVWSASYM